MALSDLPALRKKAKVIATRDLVGVPTGTEGKVIIVNGFTWIRYWVRFANGVVMGSINRADLATPEEWKRKLAGGDDQPLSTSESDAGSSGNDGGGGDGGAGGDDVSINGVTVPGKLIARSAAARARLAA